MADLSEQDRQRQTEDTKRLIAIEQQLRHIASRVDETRESTSRIEDTLTGHTEMLKKITRENRTQTGTVVGILAGLLVVIALQLLF